MADRKGSVVNRGKMTNYAPITAFSFKAGVG